MKRLPLLVVLLSVLLPAGGSAHAAPSRRSKLVMYSIGTDTHQTRLFRVIGSEWRIAWQYNCHSSGSRGNFAVEVHSRSGELQDLAANVIGWSGHSTEYLHRGGIFYLDISSECAWQVRIYGASGGMLPLHARRTLFAQSGAGMQQTRLFYVPSEWQIYWSFNCRSFGIPGNFSIEVKTRSGELAYLAVNEVHRSDYGTEYMHAGGTYYFAISSECAWRVVVKA